MNEWAINEFSVKPWVVQAIQGNHLSCCCSEARVNSSVIGGGWKYPLILTTLHSPAITREVTGYLWKAQHHFDCYGKGGSFEL